LRVVCVRASVCYDAAMSILPPNNAHPPAHRLASLVPASALRVLDCACGDGALGSVLKATPGRFVAGIERDAALAASASPLLDEVVRGDAYSLTFPWAPDSFECVVCDGLLPKLRDPAPFIDKVFDVLAPGGLFVATSPNIQFYEHFLMLARGRWQYGESGALARDHIRFYTAWQLVKLLQDAGFTSVRCGVLDEVGAEAFPLGADGHVRLGDLSVGPMAPDQHRAFLVREYLLLGAKPA